VRVKTKVCVTFDKRVCDKLNVDSGRYYNTLSVGGVDLGRVFNSFYNER
jgi:hypothetical protein